MHFLERPGDWDHAQGHGNILKLIRKFAELTGGFGEGIQLEVTMDSVMTISPTTAAN